MPFYNPDNAYEYALNNNIKSTTRGGFAFLQFDSPEQESGFRSFMRDNFTETYPDIPLDFYSFEGQRMLTMRYSDFMNRIPKRNEMIEVSFFGIKFAIVNAPNEKIRMIKQAREIKFLNAEISLVEAKNAVEDGLLNVTKTNKEVGVYLL